MSTTATTLAQLSAPRIQRTRQDWLALVAAVAIGTSVPWLVATWLRGSSRFVPEATWVVVLIAGVALLAYARWPRPKDEAARRKAYDERRLKRHLIAMAAVFYLLLIATISLILVFASTQVHTLVHIAAVAVVVLLVMFAYGRFLARRLKVSWTRPVALRVTAFGWLYGAFAGALCLVALNVGLNLLFVLVGILFSYGLVSWVLSTVNLRRIRIARELPSAFFAGRAVTVTARVRNGKRWLPSFSLWLEEGWPLAVELPEEGSPAAFALTIAPGDEVKLHYAMTVPRRGRMRFPGFTLASRFPFGLFTRYRYVRQTEEALVWPVPAPLPAKLRDAAAWMPVMNAQAPASGGRGHAEVYGVREYVQGADDVRAIHWPSTARMAKPMVRERERESTATRIVVLERGVAGAGLEQQIGVAAALIEEAYKLGAPFALAVAPEPLEAPPAWRRDQRARCLDKLAELQGYAANQTATYDTATALPWPLTANTWVIALHTDASTAFADWLATVLPPGVTVTHWYASADEGNASS